MTFGFLSHLDYNLWLFRLPIMQELVRLGHTVYAICPSGEISDSFPQHGIIHVPYTISRSSLNPLKEIQVIHNIYNALKSTERLRGDWLKYLVLSTSSKGLEVFISKIILKVGSSGFSSNRSIDKHLNSPILSCLSIKMILLI